MGFAQGVAAGRAAAGTWDSAIHRPGNPYSVMSSISRPGPGPTVIRDRAAELALKQKEFDLAERKQALAENLAQHTMEMDKQKMALQQTTEENRAALGSRAAGVSERQAGVQEGTLGLKQKAFDVGQQQVQRKNDFNMAKWGLAADNPAPIIDYFNKYGDPNSKIDNIEFGPNGTDLMVTFSGQKKPAYFKTKDDFYKSLLSFADPRVEAAIINTASKERVAKIQAGTKSPTKVTMAQALKEYDSRFKDPSGQLKPDAPPDKDAWARKFVTENMGGEGATQKGGAGPQMVSETPGQGGKKLREWSDGTKEIVAPDGSVQYVKSPDGVTYKPGTLGFKRYRKTSSPTGESFTKGNRALPQPGQAEYVGREEEAEIWKGKIPKDAKNVTSQETGALGGGEDKKSRGKGVSATYVDKKTGDTIRIKLDAGGKVVEKKVIKKGKKKDKKKVEANGD